MRNNASVSSVDRQADHDVIHAQRLATVEGVAHRHPGVGGTRQPYAVVAWGAATLASPIAVGGTAVTIASFGIANLLANDIVQMDGVARVGSSGAAGFMRLYLSVISPASVVTDIALSDSQPALNGGQSDLAVPIMSPGFTLTAPGTWTFALRAQIILGAGTWAINQNSTIVRAEIVAKYT